MKRFLMLMVLLWMALGFAEAQGTLERLSLITLDGYMSVKPGGFQAKATTNKQAYVASNEVCYDFLFIAKNESTGLSSVMQNGQPLWQMTYDVRPFLTTEDWRTSIFIVKYLDKERWFNKQGQKVMISKGQEVVYARGVEQEICDSIISVGDDGYVYRIGMKYYYSSFKGVGSEGRSVQIVYPERRIYQEGDSALLRKEDAMRLSDGDVYHYCYWDDLTLGHYYYLYRDEYMPYTVLVIDGQYVELFGAYSDEDFRLKYSYRGNHWMAVADQYFWVDGQMKSVEGFQITDFYVNDAGDYCYKAKKIGDKGLEETTVVNGKIKDMNAYVGYFNLNAQQRLTYHFFSGGECSVFESGKDPENKTNEFRTFFYEDDRMEGRVVRISMEGHTLEYVVGKEGLRIDGRQVVKNEPFQVLYDAQYKCFRWNCIEPTPEGKSELVLYKYKL